MAGSPNPALESWPYDSFGNPLRNPGLAVMDPVARVEMDRGAKARNMYTTPEFAGTYSVLLTNEQYNYFMSWHKHKINNGSSWFNLKVRSGDAMSWEEVRMSTMYTPEQRDKRVQVTFPIVQRTNNLPNEAALDVYLDA